MGDVKLQNFEELRNRGLDVDSALRFTGGEDRYITGLTRFYNAYEKNSNRIRNAYYNKDYEDYALIVHSLKSNARMIGDNELGNLAEKLQYAGEDRDIETIDLETNNLLKMYKSLVDFIEPYTSSDVEEGLSKEEVIKLLNELKDSLDDYEYEESLILHKKIAKYHFSPSQRVIYNDIKDTIEKFMYEEAIEMTDNIIKSIS